MKQVSPNQMRYITKNTSRIFSKYAPLARKAQGMLIRGRKQTPEHIFKRTAPRKKYACDKTIYTFYHDLYSNKTCSLKEFQCDLELKARCIESLISGKLDSIYGWRITPKKITWSLIPEIHAGIKNPNYNHRVYVFYHKLGAIEKGTSFYLRQKYNLNTGSLSTLITGKSKFKYCGGWSLSPTNGVTYAAA